MLKKLTPILFVDAIEDQLPFWVDTLGFQKTVDVPESEGSDKLGFAILVKDDIEVMLQTWSAMEKDIGWKERVSQSFLFIETDDLDDLEKRLEKTAKVVERRTTFYGSTEIAVLDPTGNLLIFAQFGKE